MVTIELMKQNELENVSKFISELNNNEESHIGFCGKDSKEIAEYIKEEIPYTECFVVAYDAEKLVGVIGYDPDYDSSVAEIWGPFLLEEHWKTANVMWERLMGILPNKINAIHMFPNKKNKKACELATNNNFTKLSDQAILVFNRNDSQLLPDVHMKELTPEYHFDMEKLHDETFPGTYYSGQQIIRRLNENNKVFIVTENEELCGYIYVEADPEYGESNVEFFGVEKSKRGKGIGVQLLTGAINWLFSFEATDSIILTVNSESEIAIKLYKKVGFQLRHELHYFKKIIRAKVNSLCE
ncbi:N-acetyltransferase [Paucisalibacillus sp. EB02]|uniref:GNAT family N-acetyltransferase n=1 Tax=Paucisalibacillus sp. EB02 TaxID=1347087 RepID=UPI0004BAE429|nr:GNAT family N-acetyltransferase [Paucisalibacillus sp. EB02]